MLYPSLIIPNVLTTTYEHLYLEDRTQGNLNGIQATSTYLVDWDHQYIFLYEVLGYSQGTSYNWIYVLPATHGTYPWLYAKDFRVEPYGSTGTNPPHPTKAKITIGFASMDEPFATENIDCAAEFFPLERSDLYWEEASPTVSDHRLVRSEIPGKLKKLLKWQITYKKVPFIPSVVFGYVGYINSDALVSTTYGYSFDIGTLMWGTPTVQGAYLPNGSVCRDVTLEFLYKDTGWNTPLRLRDNGASPTSQMELLPQAVCMDTDLDGVGDKSVLFYPSMAFGPWCVLPGLVGMSPVQWAPPSGL